MPHDVAGAIETLHSSIVIYIMDGTRGLSSRRVVLAFSVGVSGEGRVLRLVCIGQQSLLGGVADGSSDRFWRLDATLVSTLLLIMDYTIVYIYTLVLSQRLCEVVGRRATRILSRETVKKLYFYAPAALIMNIHIIQAPSTHYLDKHMASTRPLAGARSTYKRSRAGQSTRASSGRRRQTSR